MSCKNSEEKRKELFTSAEKCSLITDIALVVISGIVGLLIILSLSGINLGKLSGIGSLSANYLYLFIGFPIGTLCIDFVNFLVQKSSYAENLNNQVEIQNDSHSLDRNERVELAISRNLGPSRPSEAIYANTYQNPYLAKNPEALQGRVLQEKLEQGLDETIVHIEAEKPNPAPDLQHKSLDVPAITGTIYINSTSSGPIRGDNRYQFSKKLKDSSGKPIEIKEDDIYLEIKGDLVTGKLTEVFSDFAQYESFIHLPSCLFEGFQEGEKVRFYYNNELVEFTCCQRKNPKSGFVERVDSKLRCAVTTDFQTFLACLKKKVRDNRTQVYFDVDLPVQVTFMGKHVSNNLTEIDANGNRKSINDFSFYEQDQNSMHYEEIKFLSIDLVAQGASERHILNIHSKRVKREDIKIIVVKGFNGLHQVWIIIPHQFEKNQLPGGNPNDLNVSNSEGEILFDQTKHRIPGHYEHGQYYVCNLTSDRVEVGFNTAGYLQLKIDPQSANF